MQEEAKKGMTGTDKKIAAGMAVATGFAAVVTAAFLNDPDKFREKIAEGKEKARSLLKKIPAPFKKNESDTGEKAGEV